MTTLPIGHLRSTTHISLGDILSSVSGHLLARGRNECFAGVALDSRSVVPGDLFFALKGEATDGHLYVRKAILAGASGVMVMSTPGEELPGATVIQVGDTMEALRGLAAWNRRRWPVPAVAITGSVGKTTTKGMLAGILSRAGKTLASPRNYNGQTGVPLTLLGLDGSHRYAVIEVGMSFPGEIARLAPVISPDVAVLLNIRPVHLANFGSIDGIRDAKSEILVGLRPRGMAVLNADDPLVMSVNVPQDAGTITFGQSRSSDVSGEDVRLEVSGCACFRLLRRHGEDQWSFPVHLQCPGRHNVYNAIAAAAAASAVGIGAQDIVRGLEDYAGEDLRGQLLGLGNGARLINDCYNAGPDSMRAALDLLAELASPGHRIAVLGDMLELGPEAERFHRELGRRVAALGIDRLYTYGPLAGCVREEAVRAGMAAGRTHQGLSHGELAAAVAASLQPSDLVLVKGSRGMAMEKVTEGLLALVPLSEEPESCDGLTSEGDSP